MVGSCRTGTVTPKGAEVGADDRLDCRDRLRAAVGAEGNLEVEDDLVGDRGDFDRGDEGRVEGLDFRPRRDADLVHPPIPAVGGDGTCRHTIESRVGQRCLGREAPCWV